MSGLELKISPLAKLKLIYIIVFLDKRIFGLKDFRTMFNDPYGILNLAGAEATPTNPLWQTLKTLFSFFHIFTSEFLALYWDENPYYYLYEDIFKNGFS